VNRDSAFGPLSIKNAQFENEAGAAILSRIELSSPLLTPFVAEADAIGAEIVFWQLNGRLEGKAIARAFANLFALHPALRFDKEASFQSLSAADATDRLIIEDLSNLQEHDLTDEIARIAKKILGEFISSGRDEPALALIVRLSIDRSLAVLAMRGSVCDGWSKGVICEDIAKLYQDAIADAGAISDVVLNTRSSAAVPTVNESLDVLADNLGARVHYWRAQFPVSIAAMEMPTDLSPAPGVSHTTGRTAVCIGAKLAHQLKAMAARRGSTLSTLMVTALGALLSRLLNADEVVVGVIAAGQLSIENARAVGQYARTLPIRLQLVPEATTHTLLAQAHDTILAAYEHQVDDVEALLLGKENVAAHGKVEPIAAARQSAVTVIFNLDPDPSNRMTRLQGAETTIQYVHQLPKGMSLCVNATLVGDEIICEAIFDASRCTLPSVSRWLSLFEGCLGRFMLDVPLRLAAMLQATDADIAQIALWNGTKHHYSAAEAVHELVEAQVERTPEARAVEFFDQHLTYRELNARANQLARYLRKLGVCPDARVAICAERGLSMVVGLLAILKAGGAYLPLDPAYPQDRLEYMLTHGTPAVLLTESSLRSRFANLDGDLPVVDLIVDEAAWSAFPAENLPRDVAAKSSNLAYVIYTSGSTGEPKGVAMPHRALVNLLHWQLEQPDFHLLKRTAQFAALGFDVAFQEIFSTLSAGGELVLLREEIRLDPEALFSFVVEKKIERLFLPFVALQLFAQGFEILLRKSALKIATQIALKEVITAGEQLRIEPRIARLFSHLNGCKLLNHYGPTESHVVTSYCLPIALEQWSLLPPIGRPIFNSQVYVLDEKLQVMPIGIAGELYIAGECLASGYLGRDELTAARFVDNPFSGTSTKMYKTGDMARWRADGQVEYLGRNDFQVKIRGFRVELGEIESCIATFPHVKDVAVIAREDTPGVVRLVAYYTLEDANNTASKAGVSETQLPVFEQLRAHLLAGLPEYMVPAAYVRLDVMPLTPNGKLDRRALPAPGSARPALSVPYQLPIGERELACAQAFSDVLGLDNVGRLDNFFELGGNSLLAVRALEQIKQQTGCDISAPTIFAAPTSASLALHLNPDVANAQRAASFGVVPAWISAPRPFGDANGNANGNGQGHAPIAIIGMSGRFPGANSIEKLWENLLANRDGVSHFEIDSLDPSIRSSVRNDSNYVAARGVIDSVEEFDAAFFGISALEAEVLDPQHRIFLEIAWECMERAGYAPNRTTCAVGVFAGVHSTTYLQNHVMANPDVIERIGDFQVMVGNEKDYVATRVSYKLNLSGPALTINTACSTSLVAIAQAVDQLRANRCRMALAGAASVTAPHRAGYLYQEGAMLSADGSTRTFDAAATGTVFSDGASVVLLKRLDDALADGDQIFAVIRGIATNNDGGGKASFSAPSVVGQAAVIAAAHADAAVDPSTISYVEAHGTATPLGDPVEIEALTRAFAHGTALHGHVSVLGKFCKVGSIKSNLGHLVAASGAAGVIKTALSLASEVLPGTIHFETPNPKLNLAATPFVVNDKNSNWPRVASPRRAGVSSFGVGGTNAHAVLEEAPTRELSPASLGAEIFRLSARTPSALANACSALAEHFTNTADINLADAAWTLDVGRARFQHRLVVAAESVGDAVIALRDRANAYRAQRELGSGSPRVAFVFPGQGAQYAGMGRSLYASDVDFRVAFDECIAALSGELIFDLKAQVFEGGAASLVATEVTQPATFCLEYALARMWMSRGLKPALLIGHSVGEFVAAVIAGVMTLADAAKLVAKRGAILQALPAGSMLSVRMSAMQLETRLPPGISLAAENGPTACVVAGECELVGSFAKVLENEGVIVKPLHTSHAFHSEMMEPAVAPFQSHVGMIRLSAPAIPMISTVTGRWMSDAEATDPMYWAQHLRATVRFSPAINTALADSHVQQVGVCFVEVGPRATLSSLVRQHVPKMGGAEKNQAKPNQAKSIAPASAFASLTPIAIPTLSDSPENESLSVAFAEGQLWTLGIELQAQPVAGRQRVLLPTYPFERKRYWLNARHANDSAVTSKPATAPEFPHVGMPLNAVNEPLLEQRQMSIQTQPQRTMQQASRQQKLIADVCTLFEDVSGMDLSSADAAASFMELGLDSLTLTQASIQLKKSFGFKVTFRELMEKYRSFEALAAHLNASLPADSASTEPVVAAVPTAPVSLSSSLPSFPTASNSAIEQLIRQQIQIMSQQLALLSGTTISATTVPSVVAPVAPQPQPQPQPLRQAVQQTVEIERSGPVTYDVKKAFGAIARIHTQRNSLSERQSARLGAFIRRYVEKTQKSKAYTTEHRSHLADPRVVNNFRPTTKEIIYQIVVERSKGARLWDIDGNEYVDALNGFGMSLFGWQPDFIQDAIRKQLDSGYDVGPMHPLAGEVAKLVCEMTGYDRAGFCNTGSEAVMAAIRIARTVTGRSLMVTFAGSYHGTFDEVIVRAGRKNKGIPAAPGIMSEAFGNILVLEYGTPESLEIIREHADELAAVLVEPVQSRRPEFQPKEFLREVRAITEKSGTCLIFDEVITGFRSHQQGVQGLFNIRADLGTYGKVVGGGYPIGVIAGKREYMDALDGGAWQYGDDSIPTVGVTYFAGTFVRHPLALAAAKAALVHLKSVGPDLQASLNLRTAAMADELNAFCQSVGAPITIKNFASLWRATFDEDHPLQDLLFAMMRSRGVHILDNFPCFFTTAHTADDVAIIKTAFKESVLELQEADLLPKRGGESQKSLDAGKPPAPGARIGRDPDGRAAWFVPNPDSPGKYLRLDS
jgi:amino acid adenylation domain-containing protein